MTAKNWSQVLHLLLMLLRLVRLLLLLYCRSLP
jgi:hypothetical protein